MPLSFESESHGNIAFGFFNIESDMLLLENYFFFADDFCQCINELAEYDGNSSSGSTFQAYHIIDKENVGDLMGAIHKVRFTGFIGDIYKLYPFPDDPNAFKQNPKGDKTRKTVQGQIQGISNKIIIKIEPIEESQVKIGQFLFDLSVFHRLIKYVLQGGYPRWKDELQPEYVSKMEEKIQKTSNPVLKNMI